MIVFGVLIAACIAWQIVLRRRGVFLWEVLPNDEVWEIPMIGKTDD